MQIPKGVNLWVIPSINPDGTALDRRGNANRVDLNRNFPHGWARIGQPGYWQYAGPNRASEPETKATIAFFREIKPALGLWYHQDLNIISPGVGFEGEIRARYGALTGLPMKRITGGRYTGVAATWQKKGLKNSMAFVVELGKTENFKTASAHFDGVRCWCRIVVGNVWPWWRHHHCSGTHVCSWNGSTQSAWHIACRSVPHFHLQLFHLLDTRSH